MPKNDDMYPVKCFYCGYTAYIKVHPYISYRSCPVCGRNIKLKPPGQLKSSKKH